MQIIIRTTHRQEYFATEQLTRETFWNLYQPGCSEHFILHQLRKSDSYISELDLVALYRGEIVGHIISTKAKVTDHQGQEHEILCVGPLSVEPALQHRGIGTKLLNHSIDEARRIGYGGMILFGNPAYYHRFGFKNAQTYGITTKDRQNFDAFMALELSAGSLNETEGRFFEDPSFETNEKELDAFEFRFPAKTKGSPKIKIGK